MGKMKMNERYPKESYYLDDIEKSDFMSDYDPIIRGLLDKVRRRVYRLKINSMDNILIRYVANLDLPSALIGQLRCRDIHFIGDLVDTTESSLRRGQGIGDKFISCIKIELKKHNLELKNINRS